jgi:hypothetical protein
LKCWEDFTISLPFLYRRSRTRAVKLVYDGCQK